MKKILFITSLFCNLTLMAQTTVDHFFSARLNSKRDITVKLPKSYQNSPERKYPMFLILDAEFLMPLFEGTITYGNYWDDMPEVILVGINQNSNNQRDQDAQFDPAEGLPTQTGAAFFEFIGAELLPHLEKKYRISDFRTIAGLDVTATLANAFLYKENPIFNGYIIISPDLASGMTEIIPNRLAKWNTPAYYYLATSDGDLKKIQDQCVALDTNLKTIKSEWLNYKFDNFKSTNHYGIAPNAVPSALYQMFEIYHPISSQEYQEKIVVLKEGFTDYLINKYKKIQTSFDVNLKPRLNDIKAIEYAIKKNEAWHEYEQLAQLSGQTYDKTMLYEYHMGMYWEKRGEIKKALKFYQDAFTKLEIGELTKDFMMNKAEEMKQALPKKDKMKGGKVKDNTTEQPLEQTPPQN